MSLVTNYGHTKAKSQIIFSAQIQNPLQNKHLGFGYKALVFSRNNGWIIAKNGQGTHSTKMGADNPNISQMPQKISAQNVCLSPKV